jgi:hypothetical protein
MTFGRTDAFVTLWADNDALSYVSRPVLSWIRSSKFLPSNHLQRRPDDGASAMTTGCVSLASCGGLSACMSNSVSRVR